MPSFDQVNMGGIGEAERIVSVILSNRYLSMATVGTSDTEPWVAPLAYVVSPSLEFFFCTSISSRHARQYAEVNQVACCIFDSAMPSDGLGGVQFSGKVYMVEEDRLPDVTDRYFLELFPDQQLREKWMRPPSDFLREAPQRFFYIKPERMYTIDSESPKVDRRVSVPLYMIQKVLLGQKQ